MAVDYEDSRFAEVEADKQSAMTELEQTYDNMISQSDSFYQAQIDASKEWAEKQSQLQQEQTDFSISKIQQEKDQAQKDYTKEQSAAYKDWQKQSNQYGANAEAMAAQGMGNTGYSESAQVSMYNTYQNRVATARESYNQAVLNYNNAMEEARLQNNATLAEIAATALQQQLELALSAFQYKNQLLLEKVDQKTTLDQMYYNRTQDVLAQINEENALAEQIRQYNESLAEEKRQFDESLKAAAAQTDKGTEDGATIEKDGETDAEEEAEVELKQASDAEIKKSVLDLGYGSLSAADLADKIQSGEVIVGNDGTFFKAADTSGINTAASALYGNLLRDGLLTAENKEKVAALVASIKKAETENKPYVQTKDEQEEDDLSIPYAQRRNY